MKKHFRWKYMAVVLCVVLVSGIILSGCGMGAAEYSLQQNYITIGCVSPLSGALAACGEGTLETEEAAVAEINESEGLYIDTLQRKLRVRFVVADSRSSADGAKEAATQLIEKEHADLVICSSGTQTAIPVAKVCEEKKIPFFSVGADPDLWLAEGPFKYCFNCGPSQAERAAAIGEVWLENGITSGGFLAVQSDYSDSLSQALSEFCSENGISFTDSPRLDPETPDYSGAIKPLASAKVQSVVCDMPPAAFSGAWQSGAIKSLGLQMCLLESVPFFAAEAAKIAPGAEIQEFYTITSWDKKYPFVSSLTGQTEAELAIDWENNFLSPASEAVGYKHGSVEVAVNALKLAMALDADAICSAARSLNVDTVLGTIDFDEQGSCIIPCSIQRWSYDVPSASWGKELFSHSRLKDVEFEEE